MDAFVLLFWEQLVGVVWWMVRGGVGESQVRECLEVQGSGQELTKEMINM